MRLAEKVMANTFHCQKADCSDWAVVEDNVFVFHCPVCRQTNCLTCQAIHDNFANCKEFQDRVNNDSKRNKEMIDVIYLYYIFIEMIAWSNIDVLDRRWVARRVKLFWWNGGDLTGFAAPSAGRNHGNLLDHQTGQVGPIGKLSFFSVLFYSFQNVNFTRREITGQIRRYEYQRMSMRWRRHRQIPRSIQIYGNNIINWF